MNYKPLPTQARVQEVLNYDRKTGIFTWRESLSRRTPVGIEAGHAGHRGWLLIRIDKELYLASRLAWLYVTGEDPGVFIVDHKNRVRHDNRFSNLRLATKAQNAQNSKIREDNTSGTCGVSFDKERGLWYAYIRDGKKMRSLGRHATYEEARAVRIRAELALFTHSSLKS